MVSKKTDKFQHPPDIRLPNNPLIEAWLEIQWKLAESDIPNFKTDPYYPFALGVFYNQVKDVFGFHEELPASKAPEMMLPHIPQHRFRTAKDGWPLLQIGPGVATINFSKPYSWSEFKEKALYLQQKLIQAYSDGKFETQAIILRYRNGYPFEYSTSNLLDFLKEKLNFSISLPKGIPGYISTKPYPSNSNIIFKYMLDKPQGSGKILIGTALRNEADVQGNILHRELIFWEFELASTDDFAPDIKNTDKFIEWLDSAHSVIHEWFFSIVEGELLENFSKG